MLQTTWQRAQARGIVFIGVDFQDPKSDGLSFLQKYAITYPNVLDPDGSTAIHYGITFTPTTFFINRQGRLVGDHILGPINQGSNRSLFRESMALAVKRS